MSIKLGAMIDANGNVTSNDNDSTLRVLTDLSSSNRTMTYGYDDMNRLLSGAESDSQISATMIAISSETASARRAR